jgi:23S rRNA (uracil1939-C5)-methyltransferase
VDECLIAPEGARALLDAVRRWYRAQRLHAFDSRSKEGFLRVLLVREAKRTGQRMVVLITAPGDFDRLSFVDAVQAAYPAQSIQRGVFRGLAQGAFAEDVEALDGEAFIEERLIIPGDASPRELAFRISPFSFFQTNTLAAEVLYGEIRAWFKARPARVLYDLYGGSGGIALACADLAEIVRSAEFERAASRDGEFNARRNGAGNVYFQTAKMKNYLLHLLETGGMEPGSAAVVDPPRAGLTPKVLRRLIECAPERLLYVSCNPAVLAQELPAFLQTYALADLRAVDLFPHTAHVEVLAALERRG